MELSEYESTQVLRPLATTKHVYHYTSVSAFQQIVETQELWLTDYPYLNDATEIRHGLAIAMRVFEETLRTFSGDTKRMLLRLLSLSADQQPRVCVGCFSLERDSLTQWKGYGRGSLGVAFGVDPPIFAEGIRNGGFMRLAPIVYSDSSKEYLIRSFVHDWASLFELDCRDTLEQDFSPYEHLPKIKFYDLLAMFKDYAFHDEREYRFIYQEGDTERRFFKAPKRFRVAGPLLVPFTTTDGLGGPEKREPPKRSRLEIAEVLIGPHPHGELAAAGLREFLQSHGYGHVPVVVSLVPYR